MGRTLLIIKPDAVERNLIGEIISRFERARFIVAAVKMVKLDYDSARRFYAVHEGKPFLDELCKYMSSGPVVAMVIKSDGDTVEKVRQLIGVTDPSKAAAGTVRYDLGVSLTKNSVHASDSPQNAEQEINFFFS
jgi:nucleoside-diphosphate kinase